MTVAKSFRSLVPILARTHPAFHRPRSSPTEDRYLTDPGKTADLAHRALATWIVLGPAVARGDRGEATVGTEDVERVLAGLREMDVDLYRALEHLLEALDSVRQPPLLPAEDRLSDGMSRLTNYLAKSTEALDDLRDYVESLSGSQRDEGAPGTSLSGSAALREFRHNKGA